MNTWRPVYKSELMFFTTLHRSKHILDVLNNVQDEEPVFVEWLLYN